ncbi:MAG: collagen binding domain-containing protein [Chloroflexia bacterium]
MARYKSRNRLAILGLAVCLITMIGTFHAVPTLALTGSPFESADGNLVVNGGAGAQDWANAPNLRVGIDLPTGQQDDSFGQGTKEDTEVPSVVDGSIPNNKSDLTRFYVANERVGTKEFLYLAWERVQEPSGTTNMDFEFNQSTTLSSNGVTPVRTAGDLLIKYDLSQGGTNPVLGYHRWVTTGNASTVCEASSSLPCWDKVHSLTGNFEGSINAAVVTDPVAPGAPRTLSVRTFGEAAINLTDSGILPPGSCNGFGRGYLKSRSSDSFTAAVKDFVRPIAVNISNCGTIVVHKQTDPDGAAGTFGFTTASGLTPPTFNLQDNGVITYSLVQAGTYSVSESDSSGLGFDLSTVTCSATTGSSASTSVVTRTASINLQANGLVDCTFTNRQRGHIIIDKVTDPSGDPTSFPFTLTGGPSTLNQSFSLTDVATPHDSGPLLAGSGYSAAETTPSGWDQASATCSDGSPVGNISVSAGETVTCTFTNRARALINIHKQDDNGNPLQGAVFTLFTDNAPLAGPPPHGAEDTATATTCTTGATGDCSMTNLIPGQYWIVETAGVIGYALAPDQNVILTAGQTRSLTFVDPRNFKVIVLVCQESNNHLYASRITVDGEVKVSLPAGSAGESLCSATTGATYGSKQTGNHPANVEIPATPVP